LRHDPLIKAIADETVRKLPHFSAQGLANTLWGFATLVIKGQECLGESAWQLICAILEEIIVRLPDCTTQELSNSSWACCRLGVRHDKFMEAIAKQGQKMLTDYTPQDLANTAMAFAKPNIHERAFLAGIAREARAKMWKFEAREVSNITWSLMIMGPGIVDKAWLDTALEHFYTLIADGEFEGWEMVQLLNAVWSQRQNITQWAKLATIFYDRVYKPIIRALAAIVDRDHNTSLGSMESMGVDHIEAEFNLPIVGGGSRLLKAGPLTASTLAAAANPPPRLAPLDAARAEAQRLVTKLQVDFLGPVFTRAALHDLGFVDPSDQRVPRLSEALLQTAQMEAAQNGPDWGIEARDAVSKALVQLKSELPFMWFDRFGPHERRVLCWISYDLCVEVQAEDRQPQEHLSEAGRIAGFSLDEHRALNQRGCETYARLEATNRGKVMFTLQDVRQAQQWLQGLFAQHDRAGHAERQALLEVVLEVVGAVRRLQQKLPAELAHASEASITEGLFDGSFGSRARGQIRLYVCHFCCISCLAAISNFARRFPQVTLHVDYDDCWKTRSLDV